MWQAVRVSVENVGVAASDAGDQTVGAAVRFDHFMDRSLYGPDGFYTVSGRAGRRVGDFITSPEVGPLFGLVISRWINQVWHEMGKPDPVSIVEIGAGPGTLARSILASGSEVVDLATYTAVELSAAQREVHPEAVVSVSSFDEVDISPGPAIVIANELFDNIPFRLMEKTEDGWCDVGITDREGRLVESLSRADLGVCRQLDQLAPNAAVGARIPLQERARKMLAKIRASVGSGALLAFDYFATTSDLAAHPQTEWLRTFSGHRTGTDYLNDPGAVDITSDVCLDQLSSVAEPKRIESQRDFLQRNGIDLLVAEGQQIWDERASIGDLEAMRARSRVVESEALLDPTGLGAFKAVTWMWP